MPNAAESTLEVLIGKVWVLGGSVMVSWDVKS
jgi:hypothetical protein